MEELYDLPDGSQVDISDYSQFEKTSFLMENPRAKKSKDIAKSANVMSKKPQAQNMESARVDGSLGSQKFRLAGESDLTTAQKRGILPPPSAQPRISVDEMRSQYDLKPNIAQEKAKFKPITIEQFGTKKPIKTKIKLSGSDEELKKFVDNFSDNPVTGQPGEDTKYKVAKLREKIQLTDSELEHPYMYYSSANQEQPDDFIEKNYNKKELEALGINTQDFDGYLNKKGYKDDFLKKEAEGLFEGEGRNAWTGYNIGLARELSQKKMLNMYMEDMQRRDFTKQDLNQDIEIVEGNRQKKDIVRNELFDTNGIAKYVEKNFPIITEKLKERDTENAKIYQESKKGGTDFFSWDTAGKMAKAGWNSIVDRTSQLSASAYQMLGMEGSAEGIRFLDQENKFLEPDDRGMSYVSGKSVNYDGTKYIVDSKGDIYDADAKIRVTDLFDQKLRDKLVEDAKYGPSDWAFSAQGAAVQTSGVMADMLIQAAVTHGIGELGAIASETRLALNGARKTSAFTSLLNDSSALLKKIPLDRATGYSMIAQGTLGYSQGYEETLKAARDNGINDKEAFELAGAAAQRMAVLYGTTGVINPQTKVVENIFGEKAIIKKAIDQYTKTGTKGFISYLDDMIRNTPRNLVQFAEEGGKEVIQENTQQLLENKGVNVMTNRDAGKKIMNETFSADDFMNTSMLSFISAGLMSKVKLPSFHSNDQMDDLMSLSTLAKNKNEFTKIIDGLVGQKVYTVDQAKTLKEDVDVYANNINKILKTTPPDAAMPIMRELDKVTKLTNEKQIVDKAFHAQIDKKIEDIRNNINKIYYESELKVKNEAIEKAIKKGVAKGISMRSFSTTQEVQSYLVNELGMPQKTAEIYLEQPGFALNSETLKKYSKDPNSISDKSQVIVVNESLTRDAGVIQHEFLHGVLQNTLKDNPEAQKLVGKALATEIRKMNDELMLKGSNERTMPDWFIQRMKQYTDRDTKSRADAILEYKMQLVEAKGDPSKIAAIEVKHKDKLAALEGVVWEEALTIYSDALRRGYVTYNESTFTKLGDVIRRVLQRLGIKDIKFNSGKDVYNFIKDYNNSVETGNWGKALTKMSNKGAEINIKPEGAKKVEPVKPKEGSTFSTTEKFSLGEKKSSEQIKKDVNKGYNKEKWSVGSNAKGENPAINNVLYDILSEYEYIIKGKAKALGYANLPDYSDLDMISETQMELIPHIRNFNKEFFQKREEYKKELEEKGLDPKSQEFKDKVEEQDQKGYKGKKGIIKENDDLNAWINSQLVNKMGNALRSGNVTTKTFTEDIEGEGFKEKRVLSDFAGETGEESDFLDESDSVFDAEQDFEQEQSNLAVLLSDPVFRFVDEQGKPINIETIPFGTYVTQVSDPGIAANIKLRTETDAGKISDLKQQLIDLERGLELESKKDITPEERGELKSLKSFKSYDLSSGEMVNTFEALSIQDTPAKIITDEVGREILNSPNIETLEFRNFKERLSDLSKTMARRMTFKNGPEIQSLMYNQWKLLYDIINHPVDPVTGQSSYASKKLPPTLKEFDEKGNLKKIEDITRVKFLQAFYEIEDVIKIISKYGGKNADEEIKQIEEREINPNTGKPLSQNAHFDRRTALMELFGDVMVLQEARRLIRQPEFLDRVAERNVNLYNDLKNDLIRAEVLKDLSKGKSDIVKFSLTEEQQSQPSLLNSKKLLKTQKALFEGIANNIYYGPDSLPVLNNVIKFSLSEVLDQKIKFFSPEEYKTSNKKYLNNYKDIVSEYTDTAFPFFLNSSKNYYIRALEYSDTVDTEPGSVKLHTLKNYEEVEKEVVRRTLELIDSISIKPGDNIDSLVNPFLIQEYKEDYIDKMLQKAIDENDQAYIEHFTALKNDEDYRNKNIETIQQSQFNALSYLVDAIYYKGDFDFTFEGETDEETTYNSILKATWHNGVWIDKIQKGSDKWNDKSTVKYKEPNGLKLNPFFAYLFLNDALSNRYISNPIEQTVERKPFKRSQYKTTFTPIDSYNDEDLIKKIFSNYNHIELKNPAFVYGFLNMQKNEKYVSDWEKNRSILNYNGNRTFKFKKSNNEKDILSLNSFASRNTNKDALWCTGQRSLSFATTHLTNGDFFIVSDNNYAPKIAVRLQENSKTGIGEVVGVETGQSFKAEEIPLIVEVFKLSDLNEKQVYIDSANLLYSLLTSKEKISFENNTKQENSDLINNALMLNRNKFFRFELQKGLKKEIETKIADIKEELKELDLLAPVKSLSELIDEDFQIIIENEEQLEVLESTEIITAEELNLEDVDEDIAISYINEAKQFYNLNNLTEIDAVWFKNVYSFRAPNLSIGQSLSLTGEFIEGTAFVYLPDIVDYSLNIDVSIDSNEDFNHFDLSIDEMNFNGNSFTLTTGFKSQENSSINIVNANGVSDMFIYGYAKEIWFPNDLESLYLSPGEHENTIPDSVSLGIKGKVKLMQFDFTDQDLDEKIETFTLFNKTSIDKTRLITKKALTEKTIKKILKSDIGLASKEIEVRVLEKKNGSVVSKTTTIKSNVIYYTAIKFSLAEEENGKISNFLEDLSIKQQFLVARDIDEAIVKAKTSNGESVKFVVPSRSKFSDKSTAYFIIDKAAQGYNDFEFAVKKNSEGPLTKQVLNSVDIKSEKVNNMIKFSLNLEEEMNNIIEQNKGVKAEETFSAETAKNLGKNIGKNELFLPPEDEDFLGLLYTLASAKGKTGEEQLKFLTDNLLKPYSDAMLNLMRARQVMYKDWNDLINKKYKGINKTLKSDSGYGGYLTDQAVRVYLWKKAGYEIPGLDKKDIFHLVQIVRNSKELRNFAEDVSLLSKQANGYIEPDKNWGFGSIVGDINDVISKSNRKKYLEPWVANVDKIFSKQNLNKIEAVYGRKYVNALNNIIARMKTGSNRVEGGNDAMLNWINGATAVTMFANVRSAVLQTLGAVNYINTSDNNVIKAGAALLNVPQYLADFKTIWNSEYLVDRRSGLMNDVAEAELAQIMNDPNNKSMSDKFKAANYWLLKNGYAPTRYADSFAIAFGGAGFYRNRLNTYKKEGMTDDEAKKATMRDFYETSEASQQSADVSKISSNQASIKGRLLLSFLNTPFQYSRIIKRSVIDLAKGRGSAANNIAKIVYYSTIQNIFFNFMQNALFSLIWDDDEEKKHGKFDAAKIRTISGAMDTLLRGSGMKGVVLSTVKNVIIKWYEKHGDPKGYGDVLLELTNISPSIGIKTRALVKSYKAVEYNVDEIIYKGFSLDNKYAIEALTSLTSAATNIPVDRLYLKMQNVANALDSDLETWQRIWSLLGYSGYNLGIKDKGKIKLNSRGQLKIPELSQGELKSNELK